MRVLHVITGLNVGGAETMLARLIEYRERSMDIHPEVVSLLVPGRAGERISAAGVRVDHLKMRAGIPSPWALVRLARIIHRRKPDVIVAWMHHAQLTASLSAAMVRSRAPIVWNIRHSLSGYADEKPMTRLVLRLQTLLSKYAAAIIFNSRAAMTQYRELGFSGHRNHLIGNGFTIDEPSTRDLARASIRERFSVPEGRLVIAVIARAAPMKDVPNIIAAFDRVVRDGLDAHLLLVGEGMDTPDESVRAALARIPGSRVTLEGHRADVGAWIGGVDIVVSASAWGEGFPNIIGEAMLNGVPCVGTDVGDTQHVIGDTGIVVPPRNADALAQALLTLGRLDQAERRDLGDRARERIRVRHNIHDVVDQYARLCRELGAPNARSALRYAGEYS